MTTTDTLDLADLDSTTAAEVMRGFPVDYLRSLRTVIDAVIDEKEAE